MPDAIPAGARAWGGRREPLDDESARRGGGALRLSRLSLEDRGGQCGRRCAGGAVLAARARRVIYRINFALIVSSACARPAPAAERIHDLELMADSRVLMVKRTDCARTLSARCSAWSG